MGTQTLELMVSSGCRRLLIGAESGVQEELDLMRKQFKVEDTLHIARILKDYDITPHFTLMVGLPGSEPENIIKTLNFGRKLKLINPKAEVKINFFRPYPKTFLWPVAIANGFLPPSTLEEWSKYDCHEIQVPWIEGEYEKIIKRFNEGNYHSIDRLYIGNS